MSVLSLVAQPPHDMVMDKNGQTFFTVFVHIPWVILFVVALRMLVRDRTAVPLLFMAGGALAAFFEPIVDVLGMCFFPREGQWIGLTSFDRPVPIFMWAVYSWFVGGQAFLWWRALQRGSVTRQRLWKFWLVTWVVNVALETPGLLMHVYTYYGKQPFNFWGFPIWWASVNATMPLLAGFLVYKLTPHLTGLRILAIIPIVPMADGVANGAIGWPVWTALNTDSGFAVSYIAGTIAIALGGLVVWALGTALPAEASASRPDPAVPANAKVRPTVGAAT